MHRRHRNVVRSVHSSASSHEPPHKSGPPKHGAQSAKAPAHTHASSKRASHKHAPSKASQHPKSRAKSVKGSASSARPSSARHSPARPSSKTSTYSTSTLRQLGSSTSSPGAPSGTAGTPVVHASDDDSGLSGGAIAGIAIGAFAGLVLIALLAYLLSRWKPSARSEDVAPAPAFAAEPPIAQATEPEPEPAMEPSMEPTTYAAQDATYAMPAMPTHYTTDILAPYMEQEPAPPPPLCPVPQAAAADDAPISTARASWDLGMYNQDPIGSARRQNVSSRPSSLGSFDKYDAYAESWPARRPPQHKAADASMQDGASYMSMDDWNDSASELPYIRTPRRRGMAARETRRRAPIS